MSFTARKIGYRGVRSLNAISSALLAALLLLASGGSAQPAGIAGVWERDPERSDDAAAILREWMGEEVRRPRGLERPPGRLPEFLIPPESLEIEANSGVDPGEARIYTGDEFQIFYLDDEKRLRQDRRGSPIETKAKLSGGILTIREERKFPAGDMKTMRTFEADGEALVVRLLVEPPRGKAVTIRTVYRRAS